MNVRHLISALALIAPATSLALTLEQATAEAAKASVDVAVAKAGLERAKGRETAAGALFPSDTSIDASYGRALGGGLPEGGLELELSQEVEIGGRRGLRTSAAGSEVRAAEGDARLAEQAVISTIARSFSDAWRASERVRLATSSLEASRSLAEAAGKRAAVGDLSELSSGVVQVDAARATATLASARAAERRARAELGRLLGRPAPITEVLELPSAPARSNRPLEELVEAALAGRADLAALRARVAAADARASIAGRSWLPNPSIRVGYGNETSSFDSGSFSGDPAIIRGITGATDTDRLARIGLSIPLPSFARGSGARDEARADVLEAEARVAGLERSIAAEVHDAYATATEADEIAEAIGGVAKVMQRNEALSRKGFEAGELTLSDYLLARNTAIAAAGELIDARAAAVTAGAALVAVTGGR